VTYFVEILAQLDINRKLNIIII